MRLSLANSRSMFITFLMALGAWCASPSWAQDAAAAAAAGKAETAAKSAAESAVAAASAAATAASAAARSRPKWEKPADWVIYLVVLSVFVGMLSAILNVRGAINTATNWSLADALSEEVPVPVYKEVLDTSGKLVPVYERDAEGKPVTVPLLRASSSRVIALLGTLAILFLFLGFGAFALFGFGSSGYLPESIHEVVQFLLAGLTLFAPYAVNKLSTLFGNIGGK